MIRKLFTLIIPNTGNYYSNLNNKILYSSRGASNPKIINNKIFKEIIYQIKENIYSLLLITQGNIQNIILLQFNYGKKHTEPFIKLIGPLLNEKNLR